MIEGLDDAYPLTPLQSGMLYETLKHPNSDIYVAYIIIDIQGSVDRELLHRAWVKAVRTHETLRTRFLWEGLDEPLQLVNSNVELNWIDCSNPLHSRSEITTNSESIVDYWLSHERSTPISLSESPPMRLRLIGLPDARQVLIWTVHHLLADDWSTPLVLKSVADNYNDKEVDVEEALEQGSKLLFSQYAEWMSRSINNDVSVRWWEKMLMGARPTPLVLGSGQIDAIEESNVYSRKSCLTFTIDETEAVAQLSRSTGCTLSSVMHAAWALVVARYATSRSALFGTSVSGRTCELPHITQSVGLFLNTLPTQIALKFDETIVQFLSRVQVQLFEQISHEHVSLTRLAQMLNLNVAENMFDTVLVVEAHGSNLSIDIPNSGSSFTNIRYVTDSNYPLTALVFPGPQLGIQLVAQKSLFPELSLHAIASEFASVIRDLCSYTSATVNVVIDQQEQRARNQYPTNPLLLEKKYGSVDEWIVQGVDHPETRLAIIDDGTEFTYSALFEQARCVRSLLDARLVRAQFVGIHLERGFHQIASILGVLMSGNAYVPLDCKWPNDRILQIVEDAPIAIILSDAKNASRCNSCGCELLKIETCRLNAYDSSLSKQSSQGRSVEDAAYMIYTSGSTGIPKGVCISHKNLLHSTLARLQYYEEVPERFLLLSPFSFDSSIAGIFWTLGCGGTLILPGQGHAQDIHSLQDQISHYKVTHTLCIPSLYALLLRFAEADKLKSLKCVISAGESSSWNLRAQHVRKLPHARLFNEYGPTEATVWATVAELTNSVSSTKGLVPIGQPIPGINVRVVDTLGNTCPQGVIGELLISGVTVASGYHREEKRESGKLSSISSTVDTQGEKSHVYRTGDQAVLGTDSQLYFLGRNDHQLKVRGYRIEPGEVEARILCNPNVMEACCVLHGGLVNQSDSISQKKLVCFYTLTEFINDDDETCKVLDESLFSDQRRDIEFAAMSRISAELPEYFSVSEFAALTVMPRLANGKLNALGFPKLIQESSVMTTVDIGHLSSIEASGAVHTLCQVLAQLLGLSSVSHSDNFFSLGGDSLTAIRFVAACRERRVPLTIPMMSAFTTLGELGSSLDSVIHAEQLRVHPSEGDAPLTPIQRWYFSLDQPEPAHWNMAFIVELNSPAPSVNVRSSIQSVLQALPVLGTRFFLNDENNTAASIHPNVEPAAAIKMLPGADLSLCEHLIELQQEFDLSKGELIRFSLACDEQGNCRKIGVVVHHLVTDVMSNLHLSKLIVNKIEEAEQTSFPGIATSSYRNWSIGIAQHINGSAEDGSCPSGGATSLSNELSSEIVWLEEGVIEHRLCIDAVKLQSLLGVARTLNIELHELCLFVVMQSLNRQHAVRVDVETHGRNVNSFDADIVATIGWFTGFFTVDYDASGNDLITDFAREFREKKSRGIDHFMRNPERFFDTTTYRVSTSEIPSVLYNFLATNLVVDAATEAHEFVFSPLIDNRLRQKHSRRSHGIEVLVTGGGEGLMLLWRTDEKLVESLHLCDWVERVDNSLSQLLMNCDHSAISSLSETFPDSGLSDSDLDQFLSTLE